MNQSNAPPAIGDLVDIRLWGRGLGTDASPPTISAPPVIFVDVSVTVQ